MTRLLFLMIGFWLCGPAAFAGAQTPPAPAAAAAATTPEATLKSLFETLLADQARRLAADKKAPAKLVIDGPVSVEPAGNYYAITLPLLSLEYKDGRKIRIGMISINASPAGQKGEWKMTLALPTPITGSDPDGTNTMTIALGEQKVAGLWNERLNGFTKLDAAYKNLRVDFPANGGSATIDGALIRYDLSQDEAGAWAGPAYFEATGARWRLPTLFSEGTTQKLSWSAKIERLSGELASSGLLVSPALLGDPRIYTALNALDNTLSAETLNFTLRPGQADQARYTLKTGQARLSLNNVLSGAADTDLSLDFSGFSYAGADQPMVDLAPDHGRINLIQKRLPVASLSQAIGTDGAAALPMLMIQLPLLLPQAKTSAEIKDSVLAGKSYSLTMNALIKAENGLNGEGRIAFAGLDSVLASLQVAGSDARKPYAPFCRSAAAFLETIKPLGRVEPGDGQNFVHVFDLKTAPPPVFMTVNDQPLAGLLMPSAPAPPASLQKKPAR
jgi:hypothetical protein